MPLLLILQQCPAPATAVAPASDVCVATFAEGVGPVRHLVVHPSGTVVAALKVAPGLLRLRDTTGDGVADVRIRFGPGEGGTGLAWVAGWLYFGADRGVWRVRWPATAAAPTGPGEWIAPGLPTLGSGWAHYMKGIALGKDGALYVSIGSQSDNCQTSDEIGKHPGKWPCPELETRAGVWRFTPPKAPATGAWTGTRYSTGLRNAMAIGADPVTGAVWAASHGRDFLNRAWGWPDSVSAMQPAELLVRLTPGADFGWPYCHGEWSATAPTRLVRAPEYATRDVDCAAKTPPAMGFPGHIAPMALVAPPATLPAAWRRGLFLVFHGSRSRTPLPEGGHQVLFVPFDAAGALGAPRPLLTGAGAPGTFRPAGLAFAADGGGYVSDDDHGRIYRFTWRR